MKRYFLILVLIAGQQLSARSVRGKVQLFEMFDIRLCIKDHDRRRSENSSEESSEEIEEGEDLGNKFFSLSKSLKFPSL